MIDVWRVTDPFQKRVDFARRPADTFSQRGLSALSSFPTVKAGKLRRQGAFCRARMDFPNFLIDDPIRM
ncbi:MAG: hypothetical protein J0I06_07185 [Planctomycetes bacterium]|nr:hypothetical protein [Planctomycetota bacterium]